jgi:hypothetical protein
MTRSRGKGGSESYGKEKSVVASILDDSQVSGLIVGGWTVR